MVQTKSKPVIKNQLNVKKIGKGASVALGDNPLAITKNTTTSNKPAWVAIIVAIITAMGLIIAAIV